MYRLGLTCLFCVSGIFRGTSTAHTILPPSSTPPPTPNSDPDVGKDMIDIVAARGYKLERYWATTADGYVLGMFRIPRGITQNDGDVPRQAILLQHALLTSSFDFVCNSAEQSLGYILADAGYDVWFGNNRGNRYSTNHTVLDIKSAAYWDFSYDEMGKYDLPAQVDLIRGHTGQDRIPYIGHSEGTIQAFAGFSINQTLSKHISVFIALAPVAYVHHQTALLFSALSLLQVDKIFAILGVHDFLPSQGILDKISPGLCHVIAGICDCVLDAICGPSKHLNTTRLPVYLAQTPSGTSVKNMIHWANGVRDDTFARFDGTRYKLSDVTVPTALFVGGNDALADAKDVTRLKYELPTATIVKEWYDPTYAHLDFTWSDDAYNLMYPSLLAVLRSYSPPVVPAADNIVV